MIRQFDVSDLGRVVNVASVKQRSPFRYPGGKTWLVPRVRRWLASLPQRPARLIEPFAGGAIIGLTAAAEKLAEHVILVGLDEDVFDLDHARLFEIAQALAGEVLITYDQAPRSAIWPIVVAFRCALWR
jgi:DNA adenine methylase